MAKLKIHRTQSIATTLRRVSVFIDDVEVGKISDNETKEFEVSVGKHQIKLELDWLSSKPFDIEITDFNEQRNLLLTSVKNPLFALYNFTAGRDSYLGIKEI